MTREEFKKYESFMHEQMRDSAHDRFHIYRVLYAALDIAKAEENVDLDILITACLLHDIGRHQQFSDLELCHAQIGGDMAFDYLIENGWPLGRALHVKECVYSHRYRRDNKPQSIEAKILFDADKLDATGAVGIARTLIYSGQIMEPMYIFEDNNIVTEGGGPEISSFFQEYNYKLKNLYGVFYTDRATEIAQERRKAALDFYSNLHHEVTENHTRGVNILGDLLTEGLTHNSKNAQ